MTTSLRRHFDETASDEGRAWLDMAVAKIDDDPTAIRKLFAATSREVGREAGVDDLARIVMLDTLGDSIHDELPELYRYADTSERKAILLALSQLDLDDRYLNYVHDALRTNDPRLVVAALGSFAMTRLDDGELHNAVLKCVFMDVPLRSIEGLYERITPELSRMVAGFVLERVAAGRDVSPDLWWVIDKHPPFAELAVIESELQSPVEDRREAAKRALASRNGV